MKRNISFAWLASIAVFGMILLSSARLHAACGAEDSDCRALSEKGSTAASYDVVILGDGYTLDQREDFFTDASNAAKALLESETYSAYAGVFNVWALYKPSNQSGADDPSAGVFVDTAFDAAYDAFNISYLLVVNDGKVFTEIANRFPEADLVVCIVNATDYGGSGGSIAVFSLDPASSEIARHEIGHTLADLADEYSDPYPGFPDGDPEANVATIDHLDPVKWQVWLDPNVPIPTPIAQATDVHSPVGAYEGARYKTTGVFRPTPNCLMRELGITFCPVCAEAMAKRFSEVSLLIDAPSPTSPATIPDNVATPFTATYPELDHLSFAWSVDGEPLETASPTLDLHPAQLGIAPGQHELVLTVHDGTPLVRNDPDGIMTETHTWTITVEHVTSMNGVGGAGGAGGAGGSGGGGGEGTDDEDCECQAAGAPRPPLSSAAVVVTVAAAAAWLGRRRRPARRK